MTTVFFENVSPFPTIENGQISTQQLLSACESIVKFIEILGITFKPVRDDIGGNIVKLRAAFDKNPPAFETLNAMIQEENERIPNGKFKIATDALLWLTRALAYNQLFLRDFFEDFNRCQTDAELQQLPESLSPHFEKAYETSLKRHHNWMVQKIFGLCLRAVPYRSTLLQTLGYLEGKQKLNLQTRELIVKTLASYTQSLDECVRALVELLAKFDQTV